MYPNTNCSDCSDCPTTVTPLPLPDLHDICGDHYNFNCIKYTGDDIECLGIISGMMINEILNIFQSSLQNCNCCAIVPQDCVLSDWGPWGECVCVTEHEITTCTQTRVKTIIVPPLNGGTACGNMIETKDCTPNDICFTFGSNICESAPDGSQVIHSASGIYNDKPYYEFDLCSVHYVFWYNSTDSLWYVTSELGVSTITSTTLDNNNNYYPISNSDTQLWTNNDESSIDIIRTSLDTCPEQNICFNLKLQVDDRSYIFHNSISPLYTNGTDHPRYVYNVTIGSVTHTITITYNNTTKLWSVIDSELADVIATLNNDTIYPIGTWIPTITYPDSYMMTSALGGYCVQPADVDCVLGSWSNWSDCVGGYKTRTRSIVTDVSGNGTPCGPLTETQTCAAVVCAPPTAVTATVSGTSVIVSFTPAVGASTYNISYTINGGATYTTVNSNSSPITITSNLACATTYSGWIVTNCLNGVVSSQVPFTITTPTCPPALLCAGITTNIISGNFNSPQSVGLKINNTTAAIDSSKPVFTISSFLDGKTQFWTNELSNDGLFLAGIPCTFSDGLGTHYSGGVIKLKCTSPNTSFFGEVNPTFIGATPLSNLGFEVSNPTSINAPVIRTIKYDKIQNRLYVGGHFDKYKGVACSHNLVCLNAITGDIVSSTDFKIGASGIYNTLQPSVTYEGVYDIQIDGNGKIIVGGLFNVYSNASNVYTQIKNIVRLKPNGDIDTSFTTSPTDFSSTQWNNPGQPGLYSVVKTIYVDPNNDYFVGGGFYQYKGNTANHIVKILNNGNIDSTFNSGGTGFAYTPALPSSPGLQHQGWKKVLFSQENQFYINGVSGITIEKIIPHTTGLLITGNFSKYNGTTANALVKINTDGTIFSGFTLDTTTFNPLSTSTVLRSGMDIKILYDNRILFGGALNNYLGTSSTNSYYVLNSNGTINTGANITSTTLGVIPFVKTISSNFM